VRISVTEGSRFLLQSAMLAHIEHVLGGKDNVLAEENPTTTVKIERT